jgi:hypothetical protein
VLAAIPRSTNSASYFPTVPLSPAIAIKVAKLEIASTNSYLSEIGGASGRDESKDFKVLDADLVHLQCLKHWPKKLVDLMSPELILRDDVPGTDIRQVRRNTRKFPN